jgi:hypothetical protein
VQEEEKYLELKPWAKPPMFEWDAHIVMFELYKT